MRISFLTVFFVFACKPAQEASDVESAPVTFTEGQEFIGEFTLYTTENNAMEGGPKDRCGSLLGTLKDYLAGRAQYVSLAMDLKFLPYGTLVTIPEFDARLGRSTPIPFMVVDTGSAFQGKKSRRIDLCVGHSQADIKNPDFQWISHAKATYRLVQVGTLKPGKCPRTEEALWPLPGRNEKGELAGETSTPP